MSAAAGLLPSPCVGVCVLDEPTGWCVGCGRDTTELLGWGELAPARQAAIWAELPTRMTALKRPIRLLPWSGEALFDRLSDFTQVPGSVWSIGIAGASAEFLGAGDAPLVASRTPGELTAVYPGGAMRVSVVAGVRGFVHEGGDNVEIVLALHEQRLRGKPATHIVELGPDHQALLPAGRGETVFDLGLGCERVTFAVRTSAPDLLHALRAAVGRPVLGNDTLLERIVLASPTRVVSSALGRIEITAPIAQPGGSTPAGPHTHFYPARLATGVEFDFGASLPPGYVASARLYIKPSTATTQMLALR